MFADTWSKTKARPHSCVCMAMKSEVDRSLDTQQRETVNLSFKKINAGKHACSHALNLFLQMTVLMQGRILKTLNKALSKHLIPDNGIVFNVCTISMERKMGGWGSMNFCLGVAVTLYKASTTLNLCLSH